MTPERILVGKIQELKERVRGFSYEDLLDLLGVSNEIAKIPLTPLGETTKLEPSEDDGKILRAVQPVVQGNHFGRELFTRALPIFSEQEEGFAQLSLSGNQAVIVEQATTFVVDVTNSEKGLVIASPMVDVLAVVVEPNSNRKKTKSPTWILHHASTPVIQTPQSGQRTNIVRYDRIFNLKNKSLSEYRKIVSEGIIDILDGLELENRNDALELKTLGEYLQRQSGMVRS